MEALTLDGIVGHVSVIAKQSPGSSQVHAVLIGANTCTADGIAAHGTAPVLALCRALVAAGYGPHRALHAYRGDVLALVVRSIGEGARLTVEDDRHGRPRFRRWRSREQGCGAAPSVRQIGSPCGAACDGDGSAP